MLVRTGHRGGKHQPHDFCGNFVALNAQGGELLGQAGHDDGGGSRAGRDRGFLIQRLNDFGRQALTPCAVRA